MSDKILGNRIIMYLYVRYVWGASRESGPGSSFSYLEASTFTPQYLHA